MPRCHLCCAFVSELGRRGQAASVIDQRITKSNPQLRIAGIAFHRILQDSDRVLAVPVALERFGHAQPAFGGREMAEYSVSSVGQWEHLVVPLSGGRSSNQ